jgi:hypothetical protein
MLDRPDRLITAYRATSYVVRVVADGSASRHVVRLDRPGRGHESLWKHHAAHAMALITAWNPRSRRLSMACNKAASRRLEVLVRRLGLRSRPMSARPDDLRWPVEQGLAILDISVPHARHLAERFGQNAFVYVTRHRPPSLVITRLFR